MHLDSVVSAIQKRYWLDNTALGAGAGWAPTKAESKTIVERFAKELVAHHEGRATNWAVLGLCLDPTRFVAALKKEGYLRLSRRDYSDRTVHRVVKALVSARLPVSRNIQDYLKSVTLLHEENESRRVPSEAAESRVRARRSVRVHPDSLTGGSHVSRAIRPESPVFEGGSREARRANEGPLLQAREGAIRAVHLCVLR
jgi:hypothetical protein